jgi:hypothetical protein
MDFDVDPIRARQGDLERMLAGVWKGVSPEAAQRALIDAEANRTEGHFRRTLGFGVIAAEPRGDAVDYLVAVSDGDRRAAIKARLSRTRLATLDAGTSPRSYVVQRLQELTGTLQNFGLWFENVVLQEQPILLG